jgi:hypothetical protein
VREERLDLRSGHVTRVALAVEQDEAAQPEQVLLLRAVAVVQRAQLVAHLVEQPGSGFHAGSHSRAI